MSRLQEVRSLSRAELIGVAVARGCHHYSPFVRSQLVADQAELPQEILGCALLAGPQSLETFQSIRVAAMVLSDEACSPALVAAAAEEMGVSSRLAHIARLALAVDERPAYWHEILIYLPAEDATDESDFLPGISRFSLETGKAGPGRGPARIWLRTNYTR